MLSTPRACSVWPVARIPPHFHRDPMEYDVDRPLGIWECGFGCSRDPDPARGQVGSGHRLSEQLRSHWRAAARGSWREVQALDLQLRQQVAEPVGL